MDVAQVGAMGKGERQSATELQGPSTHGRSLCCGYTQEHLMQDVLVHRARKLPSCSRISYPIEATELPKGLL